MLTLLILMSLQSVAAASDHDRQLQLIANTTSTQQFIADMQCRRLLMPKCGSHTTNIAKSTVVGTCPQLCYEPVLLDTTRSDRRERSTDSSLENLLVTISLYVVGGFLLRKRPVRKLASAAALRHKKSRYKYRRRLKPKYEPPLPRIIYAARRACKHRLLGARLRTRRIAAFLRYARQQYRHGAPAREWHRAALDQRNLRRPDFLIPEACLEHICAHETDSSFHNICAKRLYWAGVGGAAAATKRKRAEGEEQAGKEAEISLAHTLITAVQAWQTQQAPSNN